jgi:N-acetyl sugar amidotransferase
MKVLFVCKYESKFQGNLVSFNRELIDNLRKNGIEIELYQKRGRGIKSYLKSYLQIRDIIKKNEFDLIHSVYTLSSILVCFQSKVPIVSSFIGSDVNIPWQRFLSKHFVIKRSKAAIFVSQKLLNLSGNPKNGLVIPFGINLDKFFPLDKSECRNILNMDQEKKYILFASRFDRPEKNSRLAFKSIKRLDRSDVVLLEIKNIPEENINFLFNACDLLLMTSRSEGSPQVIKEAMAVNCPIITTDVGDARDIINYTENCYICPPDPEVLAEKIRILIENPVRTNGRNSITAFNNNKIALKILNVYKLVGSRCNYQRCTIGLWDTSIPGIAFSEEGISNYARIQLSMMKDFPLGDLGKKRWLKIADKIKDQGKGKRYDCVIGVSGGTDSSYLLHISKEYGLSPLAVNLDNGWNSDIAVKNIKKVTSALGIDLETYVIDYEEIKDLLRAFMRAQLSWIDIPTDLAIQSILYKIATREKIKYILIGNDFRSEGKQPTEWTYGDQRLLRHVHHKFGEVRLKTFPLLSLTSLIYLGYIRGIKMLPPFNYLDYDKPNAREYLIRKYGWEYYGEHHHENLFTKWAIGYWGYEKMGVDKRIITYSAQILNGKIDRDTALEIILNPPYNRNTIKQETDYVLKKLGISDSEFKTIWSSPAKSFNDYPSYYPILKRFARFILPFVKRIIPLKPKIFYEMEGRK